MMTTEDLGAYLGVPPRTLEKWRSDRTGPRFVRMGTHVRYRPEDVRNWVATLVAEADAWMNA